MISSTPILALYDTNAKTKIRSDASSYGLGAVLLQKQSNDHWQPIAYASRALTPTEQIEKEGLAIVWACDKFSEYIIGLTVHIETDHKPLVPLFTTKELDNIPPRLQRFKMRLMRYKYTISHVPGKSLALADAPSRAPIQSKTTKDEDILAQEAEIFVDSIITGLPASESRLNEIRTRLQHDEVCRQIMEYCEKGWPQKFFLHDAIKPYWEHLGDITTHKGLLLKGERLVIPTSMRLDILDKLHAGHLGISKCRERARCSVWWPGLSKQIEQLVQNCSICIKERSNRSEPLIPSVLPDRPWQKLAADMFQLNGQSYLLVVDYFSRYPEVALANKTTSSDIITHMKSMFARHGIPEILISDNGPQFSCMEFAAFTKPYGFTHHTSSPHYPQSNGEVERSVKTIKYLLKKSKDSYIALMEYRATPLNNEHSPAELLFGRKINTTLPVADQSTYSLLAIYTEGKRK